MQQPYIGDLVYSSKNTEGEVVQQKRQNTIYGFVQSYNAKQVTAPYKFISYEEYIRYRLSIMQRTPESS
jgi:hypothetical protein